MTTPNPHRIEDSRPDSLADLQSSIANQEPIEIEWEEPEDGMEEIRKLVGFWHSEWIETPEYQALPDDFQVEAEFVLGTFAEYMYNYHDSTPLEWNLRDMEDCCLGTLPAKVSAEEVYYQAIGPVLACFFKFLGSTGRLKSADKMARRIFALSHEIVDASNDPINWGMAKSLVMSAMEAGVDMTNEEDLAEFVEEYNSKQFGMGYEVPAMDPLVVIADDFETYREPYERLAPKVGRNEPCPCGSGKKFKKCCGG